MEEKLPTDRTVSANQFGTWELLYSSCCFSELGCGYCCCYWVLHAACSM